MAVSGGSWAVLGVLAAVAVVLVLLKGSALAECDDCADEVARLDALLRAHVAAAKGSANLRAPGSGFDSAGGSASSSDAGGAFSSASASAFGSGSAFESASTLAPAAADSKLQSAESPGEPPKASIIVIADSHYATKYAVMAVTQRCYAEKHNYRWVHLHAAAECRARYRDFFFQKHCTVARWLATQPANHAAVVLDNDVTGGMSNATLDRWLDGGEDLVFYERESTAEIAAGIYIVRNTAFERAVLQMWADYEAVRPPGFSSADNGAVHLLLLEVLRLKGRERCTEKFRNLTAGVENLQPYYEFIACCLELIGPARTWHAAATWSTEQSGGAAAASLQGRVAIWPRKWGVAYDHHMAPNSRVLAPFHHNVKDATYVREHLVNAVPRGECVVMPPQPSLEDFATEWRRRDLALINQSYYVDFARVPRWRWWPEGCELALACGPAKLDERVLSTGQQDFKPIEPWRNPGQDEGVNVAAG